MVFRRFLGLLSLLLLVGGCASPQPTASPLLPSPTPSPSPTPVPLGPAVYYEAGLAYRTSGDVEKALLAFSQAVEIDPSFAPARVERGALYLATGKAEAALADAQAAIAADPTNGEAYALLGEVLRLGFGDSHKALDAYEEAVRLDPSLADALFPARWRAAVAAGRVDQMIALAREYGRRHPDDPMAAYFRGQALLTLGVPRSAIAVLAGALEEGGPAALWFALGEAYAADGAWPEALLCYEQAQALTEQGDQSLYQVSDTPPADLFGGLGAAYLHTGRCGKAKEMLERALSLGPDRPKYHTLIGQAMICQMPAPTPTPYFWITP